MVALLTAGSAILLISCGKGQKAAENNDEALITRTMDSMEIVTSENGELKSLFRAPLMEDHALAKAPFQEYRKGIEVVSYDSLGMEASHVLADYALHWTNRDLWELKGNVFVTGENGRKLFTQQLSWDRKIKKIYSNVDSKVEEGQDVFIGEGFEADDDFSRWTFRKLTGRVSVDTQPGDGSSERDSSVGSNSGNDGGSGREAGTSAPGGGSSAAESSARGSGSPSSGSSASENMRRTKPVTTPAGFERPSSRERPTQSGRHTPSRPASVDPVERDLPTAMPERTLDGSITPQAPAQLQPQMQIIQSLQIPDTESNTEQ